MFSRFDMYLRKDIIGWRKKSTKCLKNVWTKTLDPTLSGEEKQKSRVDTCRTAKNFRVFGEIFLIETFEFCFSPMVQVKVKILS